MYDLAELTFKELYMLIMKINFELLSRYWWVIIFIILTIGFIAIKSKIGEVK